MKIGGIAISLACVVYVCMHAARVWDQAAPVLLAGEALARLGVALVPMMIGYLAAALAWVALLRSFGVRAAVAPGIGAYLAAQIGKYLPGNVGHYVGRVMLATRAGHAPSTVMLAITTEFVLLLAIAGLLSLPMLGVFAARMRAAWNALPSGQLTVLALCLVAGLIIVLAIMRAKPKLAESLKRWGTQMLAPISSAGASMWLALSMVLLVVAIGLASASLLVIGYQPQGFSLEILWRLVSLYSVAWIVGTLTPGLPGGIGVREVILIEGLTPLWGAGEAVACALIFRLLTISADVVALGMGIAAMKIPGSSASPASRQS